MVKDAQKPADALRLKLHTDSNDARRNDTFDIRLYDDKKAPVWKTHPAFPDADIAVIQLDRSKLRPKFLIKAWSASNFLPPKYTMEPGEDVFLLGYPLGFHDNVTNLPVLRGGMVASAYGVHFEGAPFFLTDINLHRGTSGSPIISKPKSTWVNQESGNTDLVTGVTYYFLGVHSGTVDLKDPQDGAAIGLGAAWYASLVEEIALQF